ncbi:MAG: hypothetical protein K0Q59_2232 [Paenibacillus sp.]|jgi:hypothetical protein|nr:hypothetical protein [Paenibacillus sp.]
MQQQSSCSLLICGATFAGIGAAIAASQQKRDVVIVERTSLVGHEFIETFNPGSHWSVPSTELGRSLQSDLIRRNVMEQEGGAAHLAALHPILCQLIKQHGLQVKFLTEIVSVSEQNGRFAVELHDAAGRSRITADEVLDTSSQRLTTPGKLVVPERKQLNAYLNHPDLLNAEPPAAIDDTMSVARGRFRTEVVLKVNVKPEEDIPQARHRMVGYWQNRPEAWRPWTIAATATVFQYSFAAVSSQLADRWSWHPSEARLNALAAFDQGYHLIEKAVSLQNAAKSN